jgi:hypothetical protein
MHFCKNRRIREKMTAQSLPDWVDKARIYGILKPLDTWIPGRQNPLSVTGLRKNA